MNWSDVGSALLKYAPLAGAALTSPVGAVSGVGAIIANLFGVKSTPEDVMDYIKADPQRAAERIQYEMANNLELQKLSLSIIEEKNRHEEELIGYTVDSQNSARENSKNINESPVDNKIKMRLVNSQIIILFISVAATIGAIYWSKPVDAGLLAMLGMVIGSVLKSLNEKDGFYWGTSFGSQKKDEAIAGMGKK